MTKLDEAINETLSKEAAEFTGQFCIDDVLLSSEGVSDFSVYRVDPSKPLWSDFFVPEGTPEIEPVVMMSGMSI